MGPIPASVPEAYRCHCCLQALPDGHNSILLVPRTEPAKFAKYLEFRRGEVAERSKAVVLKVALVAGRIPPRFRLLTYPTCPVAIQQP